MKRFIILLLAVVVATVIVFTGCAQPAEAPVEPAGFPQPNPYWGLGFKPDGTQYEFGIAAGSLAIDWWMIAHKSLEGQLVRSGADVTLLDSDLKLDQQVSIMEDFIAKGVDAIALLPVDSAGSGPAADKAGNAGIPVFCIDNPCESDAVVFLAYSDPHQQGKLGGEMVVEQAEKRNEQLQVYEILCPLTMEICQIRHNDFRAVVDVHPMITMMTGPECFMDEDTMAAVVDAFPAHPELNTLYVAGGMTTGAVEGLKAIDRYYPTDHPDHLVFVVLDDIPAAVDAIRGNFMDGCAVNSAWAMGDLCAKAVLNHVCLGEQVLETITPPTVAVTPDNVDISPYGGPMRWGDMIKTESDPTKWPILDMAFLGMPTPAYQP